MPGLFGGFKIIDHSNSNCMNLYNEQLQYIKS